ncbi:hypothetical protein [Methylomonas koyamae]|uniref:hypothetical protein n=1 Tax=Methylomonas koyamae TaxID=702114 RepID=UPI000A5DD3E9|nr:hypothetical protein [Methylomonas koyamae]
MKPSFEAHGFEFQKISDTTKLGYSRLQLGFVLLYPTYAPGNDWQQMTQNGAYIKDVT